MDLTYRTASKVPFHGNSARCLVQRQQYALEMLSLLERGTYIINVDESWVNDLSFVRKCWQTKEGLPSIPIKTVQPRLSIIAAIDTEGRVWYALTQANTDSEVFMMFLRHLVDKLDQEIPTHRERVLIQVDGARYHISQIMCDYLKPLGVRLIYSGPYSYQSAPIELLFAGLKLGELNKQRIPTGNK